MNARIVVTAAEFTRQFGQLRQAPGDDPVFVTHHGRETHVLLTRRSFDRLLDGAAETAPGVAALTELADWLPHAVIVVDGGLVVRYANPAALALVERTAGGLVGRQLVEAVPAIGGSLVESYLRRVVRSREPAAADLPSPMRQRAWLQADIRPAGEWTTLLLRDITEDVLHHRLADRNRAVADAVRLHAGIGQVVLNVRGHIEAVDAATCALLGLSADRLVNVPLADLIPTAGRAAFRETADGVLRGQGPAALELKLLTNSGETLAMAGTLVELRGLYGSEGAILVLTRR